MTPVRFHPEARAELRAAVKFYRREGPEVGRRLVAEVRSATERMEEFPESGSVEPGGLRRVLLHRFPFSLFYTTAGEDLLILAVVHHRRKPGYWRDRIDTR